MLSNQFFVTLLVFWTVPKLVTYTLSLRIEPQMKKEIIENFGKTLRVRVCGILIKKEMVLMVKHKGLTSAGYLWAPPGGGMTFGQSAHHCLKKEFLEETGLVVAIKELLFINEFHDNPFHAIELFFRVELTEGQLKTGYDPELEPNQQIIQEVKYFGQKDIADQRGPQLHSIFSEISHPSQLLNLNGYFRNWK